MSALLFGFNRPEPKIEAVDLGFKVPEVNEALRQNNDCAQFAMFSVLANSGWKVNDATYQDLLSARKDTGTSPSAIPSKLWPYMPSFYHRTGTLNDLKASLREGRPAIIVVWSDLEHTSGGHGMVAVGFKTTADGTSIMLLDDRGIFSVSPAMFDRMWSGQWVELGNKL